MSSDEIIWQNIGHNFCSFKLKTTKSQTFCRSPHSLTGLCNRQSCPLANSRYATIRPSPSTNSSHLYLYIKTAERSHLPSKMWERTRLSGNYTHALSQIDERLPYWPKFLVHKCKQRLTRLTQVAMRERVLEREEERLGERVVAKLAPKVKRREEGRERKSLSAAKVERVVERELVERLRSGAYGDKPLNVEEGVWERVMKGLEMERERAEGKGTVEVEEEDPEMEMEDGDVEFVSEEEVGESDSELGDLEDWSEEEGLLDGGDDEEEGEDREDDQAEDIQKKLAEKKRKRAPSQPRKPTKKLAKRKMEIEYEDNPLQERAMFST